MADVYFYCDSTTKEIIAVTTDPLSEEQRGSRVELVVADDHEAVLDAERKLTWQMNDTDDGLESTGQDLSEDFMDPQPQNANAERARMAAALHGLLGHPIP